LGALAGVFTRSAEDTKGLVENMLLTMRHRGAEKSIALMQEIGRGHFEAAIGCGCHRNLEAKFVKSRDVALALDGSFFEIPQSDQIHFALRRFNENLPIRRTIAGVAKETGDFAGLCCWKGGLHAFRDINGLKPLYFSRTRTLLAFASERKALWKIRLSDAKRVLPGHIYSMGVRGFTETRVAQLPHPTEKTMTIHEASSQLARLLTRSIRRITKAVERVSVAFSGGLDSAVTAALAKGAHPKVELVSVGLSGSPELLTVEKYARELDLPVTVETFSPDSLEEYVRRVIWLIEEPNLMKVSVAVPLHWAAMLAARRGCDVMLCGQGSDELYGGYYKYDRTLDSKGRKALVAELYRSVVQAAEVNYERDDQATSPFGVELRTPFADLDVIRFSLGIPLDLKVKSGNDLTRKWVLRNVAKNMGLPEDIVWRRKKAIQHGTVVENAIRKLSKARNLTADAYLSKIHEEVIKTESMPGIS
jgi:asparagine synthase (glutamine-hydrolysing)